MRAPWRALGIAIAIAACTTAEEVALAPKPVVRIAPDDLPRFFDCLRSQRGALVAAHRGGPAPGFAENAIPTFERTLALAPAMIEADVTMLADGALVLLHDDTLDRTTNGAGRAAGLSLAQFEALQLKDETGRVLEAHPPSLRDALNWARDRTILALDIKRNTPIERVVEAVDEADAEHRVILIVRSAEDAITAHRLDAELMISAPIDQTEDLERLREADVDVSRVLAWTGTGEPNSALNVELAQRGVEAMFGTLGDWDLRFARQGDTGYATVADAGLVVIATDRPEAAYRALDQWDGEGWAPARCLR
jgi:glycerophosphoryl diester phosphodiesterase